VALASQVAGAFSEGIVVIDVLGVLLWMKTNNSLLWYSNFNWSNVGRTATGPPLTAQGGARGGRRIFAR
jgi:hypothetical protein